MDVAALVISVVALILAVVVAGFGILLQFLTYKATSEQTGRVSERLSGFGTDLETMIAKLQGQTETMTGVQRDQFNTMLEAFVTKPGAAAEVAEKTGESADKLEQISEAMEALKEEIRQAATADEVQRKLDELASRLEAVSESTSRAARLAEAAARPATPVVDKALLDEAYRRWVQGPRAPTVFGVHPGHIKPGGRVHITQQGWIPGGDFERLNVTVVSPHGREWSGWILQDLRGRGARHGLTFPDEFDGASTDVLGTYRVSAQRVSLGGSPIGEPLTMHFFVEETAGEGQG